MLEDEYQLDYFKTQGFVRKICKSCGSAYWTRDPSRETCGDAPCEPYNFIGSPVFKPHTLDTMREAYLSFFEQNGHTRVNRYPVAARWRDDIYLTIASIADFQPFVTSGVVPPPANPLTISQPCIRLNDLDSVGRSGRHLTTFEMMAHHAFNTPTEEIYWKDRTVELCDQFLKSIGGDITRVTYKENPWIGGGNAGPSVEVLIGGLEVATLVFMSLGRQKGDGPGYELKGEMYYPMKLRIVDTGYGLERLVWASKGSPTIYDAVFPEMVSKVMGAAGISHMLDNKDFARMLALNAKFAGLMDISGSNLFALRKKVAAAIDVPTEKLDKMIAPVEKVYAIVDHTRCLAYMLGDCIVPSNVREGYLARLVIRRTLRMMNELKIKEPLADLIEQQTTIIGTDTFEQDLSVVREIVDRETEKYASTLERGTRIVQKIAKTYKARSQRVPLSEVMVLYDSHGIQPEMIKEIAAKEGAVVDLPDNFYSMVADMHSESKKEDGEDATAKYAERLKTLPPTRRIYYDQPSAVEFEAVVLDFFDGYAVLDQTLFYPEGGGQPADTGTLIGADSMAQVDSVVKVGEVILHHIAGGVLRRGERIKGMVDEERRWSLMRHHTATHVLLHACKEVLGAHIHQAGAQKGSESSRIDIRHFKHITPDELRKIEIAANRMIMQSVPVEVEIEDRTKAEQKYGFSLYQGGVPPGREIRIVKVAGDIEACAGTHCRSTGEVGMVKIIRVEHIQDGIERIEFAAGIAAIYYMQHLEGIVSSSSAVLSVQDENLPATVTRFFNEWKDQRKEIEKMTQKLVELEMRSLVAEKIGDVSVVVKRIDLPQKELSLLAASVSEKGGVALLAGSGESVRVVLASGDQRVNAGDIIGQVCGMLGGKGGGKPSMAQGGGPDAAQLDLALKVGRERIIAALKG
ncbi:MULTISPECIES: alanine--tRNA ligase [unclassified Methanoregula]|uniref:alanine--tRNA ligase n=1 Tax=unclassified Methanoregula TaxID=2649730 RepID=UPI0009D0A89E|nr:MULTISPECIES: alanine--tRNA ligase [unclassified Methanoregula]OPX63786.1 MAG: Alanine--tRNA ligase [Methanoregula sp. PtaB.Bin085]OPY34974.1 MAG: Alanine--tRNA ligase [Methanoregula sp. PtaU1.Bin006]